MTVATTTNKEIAVGNGVATAFPFSFATLPTVDLVVTLINADGTETVQTEGADYTVSGAGSESGGTVIFTTPPGDGVTVLIQRIVPYTQPTDYKNEGSFYPRTHERSFDRLTMIAQQLGEENGRTIKIPAHVTGVDTTLPTPVAGALIGWDAAGTALRNIDPSGPGDLTLRSDLADPTGGASLVGFQQAGAGAIARTAQDKMREVVHVDDFPSVQEAVNAAASLGATLVFDGSETYSIDNTGLSVPAGSRLQTNGCVFEVKNTSTSNATWFEIAGNVRADEIRVSIPTGVRRDRCLSITGDDVSIGRITVTSVDVQPTSEANDFAVRVQASNRVRIGCITVTNYDRAVILRTSQDIDIGAVVVSSYVRGVLVEDCKDLFIGRSRIHTRSPNAAVSPGHNGLLINASSNDATRNITFSDWNIENAGEHGIRFGGFFRVSNAYLVRPRVNGSGASGIKLQGDDGGVASNYHRRINVIDPIIEDCGDNGVNDCGIYFFLAVECNIVNPIIRKEGKTYSASYGIRIRSCVAVNIVNPTVLNAEFEGIWLDGSVNDNNQVTILGGRSALNGRDGLRVNYEQGTHRRFRAEGLLLEANGGYGCTVSVNAGSGTLLDAYLNLVFEGNTAGTITSDTTATVLTARSDTPPAATTVRNGSTWQGLVGLYHRKAAIWVAL